MNATKFRKSQVDSMVKKYNAGAGLAALAEKYEVSLGVVRRVLTENGVTIRGRGRPRKS